MSLTPSLVSLNYIKKEEIPTLCGFLHRHLPALLEPERDTLPSLQGKGLFHNLVAAFRKTELHYSDFYFHSFGDGMTFVLSPS